MNFLKIRLLAINIAIIATSCGNAQSLKLVGKYKSSNPSLFQRYRNGYNFEGTVSLQLKQDATFSYVTCTDSTTGHWSRQGDSLLLYCTLNLQKVGENGILLRTDTIACGSTPIMLSIKNGQLWETFKINRKDVVITYSRQQ